MNEVEKMSLENGEEAQRHNHGDTAEEVCHPCKQNRHIFGESSAQADVVAAPREGQEGHGRHKVTEDENTRQMEQKLKEKEDAINCLLHALTDAETVTAFVSKSWMEAYEQLKMTYEDDSNNMVAAINAEWQKWWAYREQETADQFQTQWENMQWHMDDMAAHFQSALDVMQRHNLEMSTYFRNGMERLRQHMGRVIREKDDLIAELRRENGILVAVNGAVSRFANETLEEQQSLQASEDPLRAEQAATIASVNAAEVTGSDPNPNAQ
ncbi:uncharacterized protein LOC127592874 [Hippocampus zosterae]|uniref:uncharacterized protein LOC127592874 n=1 Tax=Hippocampus zosterae TaxID=109293 RepID=UPI00223CC956|nr:uncharacterized protein LOC127592874 [Hippocampus zosterae]